MKPMHIVQVITNADAMGGAWIHVRDLAVGLQRLGHQVTVLAGGDDVSSLDEVGVSYHALRHMVRPIRPGKDWRAFWEIRGLLQRLQPTIVATHSSKAGWIGRLAGRSLGLPTVFTAHGWAFTEGVPQPSRSLYAVMEWLAGAFSSKIITVSEFDRTLARQHGVADDDTIVTVHNGLKDIEEPLRGDPARDNPVRLIMIARFAPQKDHMTLIRALAPLRQLNWQLEFVGDGSTRSAVEAEVAQLGLHEHVQFLGRRGDVAERLAEAQVLVLTSNWEGFPLTILEGMRAGLPVIASDVGGVGEAVVDGETGYVVPRGNHSVLTERLAEMVTDRELRAAMGRAGRARYEQHFTIERMVEKTLAVYVQALNATRTATLERGR